MSKVIDFFKHIPETYYNWKKRNENLAHFLQTTNDNREKIIHIDAIIDKMSANIEDLKGTVGTL